MTQSTQVNVLTDETFKEMIASGVSLVDFWAEWCGPCLQQGPIVEELAAELGTTYNIAKIDVDHNKASAMQYEVASIPTLIIFKDGKEAKRLVGLHPLAKLKQALAEVAS